MSARSFDWTDLLGRHRTIVIHIPILEWAGDYHAAALFEELVWRWNVNGRQSFTAPDADLMDKLHMGRGALRGARARLAELKAVETVKRGMPPILHYSVNLDAMTASVESTLVQKTPDVRRKSAQRTAKTASTSIPEYVQSTEQSNKDLAPHVGASASPNGGECAPPSMLIATTPPPSAVMAPANGTVKPARKPARVYSEAEQIYRDVLHRTPNAVQSDLLNVAAADLGIDRLAAACRAWAGHGWNPGNVAGIVDYAKTGGNGRRTNGHGNDRPRPGAHPPERTHTFATPEEVEAARQQISAILGRPLKGQATP